MASATTKWIRAPEECNVSLLRSVAPSKSDKRTMFYKRFVPTGRGQNAESGMNAKFTRLNQLAKLLAILLGALALKHFYSTASVNELRWILAPTTLLVELVSGRTFNF